MKNKRFKDPVAARGGGSSTRLRSDFILPGKCEFISSRSDGKLGKSSHANQDGALPRRRYEPSRLF